MSGNFFLKAIMACAYYICRNDHFKTNCLTQPACSATKMQGYTRKPKIINAGPTQHFQNPMQVGGCFYSCKLFKYAMVCGICTLW